MAVKMPRADLVRHCGWCSDRFQGMQSLCVGVGVGMIANVEYCGIRDAVYRATLTLVMRSCVKCYDIGKL